MATDPDRVGVGAECPTCGESSMDALIWVDSDPDPDDFGIEYVRCESCGSAYYPGNC